MPVDRMLLNVMRHIERIKSHYGWEFGQDVGGNPRHAHQVVVLHLMPARGVKTKPC